MILRSSWYWGEGIDLPLLSLAPKPNGRATNRANPVPVRKTTLGIPRLILRPGQSPRSRCEAPNVLYYQESFLDGRWGPHRFRGKRRAHQTVLHMHCVSCSSLPRSRRLPNAESGTESAFSGFLRSQPAEMFWRWAVWSRSQFP